MGAIRRTFNASILLWTAALPLASYAAGQTRTSWLGVGYPFALTVYSIGGFLCHQRPERSFRLFGAQMPVCARCAGIYAGAAAVVALMALVSLASRDWGRGLDFRSARVALLMAALPAALTLILEAANGDLVPNGIRAASGAPLGAAVAWVLARVAGLSEEGRVN